MHKFINPFLFISIFVFYGYSQELYHRTRVWISSEQDLKTLSDLGVDLRQGTYKLNTFLESDLSESEIERVQNAGFSTDLLIENVSKFYEEQGKIPANNFLRNPTCETLPGTNYNPKVPDNFSLGSYAGYYKSQEMFDILSNMRSLYPSLISEPFSVSDTLTHEGRTIYGFRISNSPDVQQNKPRVLYTALIHAREPGTLSALIFYMWYLLENYGTDPEVTFLLDQTELYFVPLLNPDGYVRNEQTNPNGGGMHRKNRNPNHGTTNRGVDLNRNFPYLWGTTGVSFNQNSDTYPGTGAFSEPESKVFKKIAEQWGISHALNAHTFARMVLFPIGAVDNEFAVDHDYFSLVTKEMVVHSNYEAIKSSALYPASGDTDDYMYLSHGIFAMTPEIGGAFWSPQSEILDDCIDMLHTNLTLAHLPHVFGTVKELDPSVYITSATGSFGHSVQRLGQQQGPITVSITPIQGIQSVGAPVTYASMNLLEIQNGTISYNLNANMNPGDLILYTLNLDNGNWTKKDTIAKIFGLPELQLADNAQNTSNWTGGFGLTPSSFVSSPNSFSDSPNGNYAANTNRTYLLNNAIDLSNATRAVIRFNTRWFIEADWDYVQFQVSTDGGTTWEAQCGKFTKPGKSNSQNTQPVGKPIYDGIQEDWVLEEIDMSQYLGQQVRVRFQLRSDDNTNLDGFYFDDFKVHYDVVDQSNIDNFDPIKIALYPNPTSGMIHIWFSEPIAGTVRVLDALGREIHRHQSNVSGQHFDFSTDNLSNGIYQLVLDTQNGNSVSSRFSVLR